jgi:hypothetical protein
VWTIRLQGKILTPFVHTSYLLAVDSSGRIARELWWTSREFSSAGIIKRLWRGHFRIIRWLSSVRIFEKGRLLCTYPQLQGQTDGVPWQLHKVIELSATKCVKGSCKYIELAVTDSWQWMALQLGGWAGLTTPTVKKTIPVMRYLKETWTWMDFWHDISTGKWAWEV